MRKITYSERKHNKCEYCTECKGMYCRHKECVYMPEKKVVKGYPWQAVVARVVI